MRKGPHYFDVNHDRGWREDLEIAAALDAEEERLAGEEERMLADERYVSAHHRFHSYLHRGHHADQMQRLRSLFPTEQLLVLQRERMFAAPDRTLADVWSFLGLPAAKIEGLPRIDQEVTADLPADSRARLEDCYRPLSHRLRQLPGVGFSWPGTD